MRLAVLAAVLLTSSSLSAATRTQRFTVQSVEQAEQRAGVLEAAYTEFLFVSNVQPQGLPAPVSVTIYPDQASYRAAGHKGRATRGATEMFTFDQAGLNSLLMRETVSLLFSAATARRGGREVIWLRSGLSDAVETRQARIDESEFRQRLRLNLKREGPVSLDELLEMRPIAGDKVSQRRYRTTAASLTAFLLNLESGLGVRYLLGEIAAGKELGVAVERAYPGRFRDMRELYEVWMEKEVGMVRGR